MAMVERNFVGCPSGSRVDYNRVALPVALGRDQDLNGNYYGITTSPARRFLFDQA
jgi:hypothetical protein